jgi:RNA polymerase sigma-70 factor (ECF subfamily)
LSSAASDNLESVSSAAQQSALLARLRAGDDDAFDELVRSAGGRMLAVARRMLGGEEDAQDAVQEAFLSAFKSLDRFDERSLLTTWLHRITVNACLMRLRSKRRRPERSLDDLLPTFRTDGHQTIPAGTWKPDPAAGIQREELCALVRTRIDELPAAYREIILLRDIAQLDTEQTADLLGITVPGVKTRLHRARQALKTMLDQDFVEGKE